MSVISMKQLLEAGVHFGHQSRKWNPKMKEFIFTARNDIHIINLELTSQQVDKAYSFVRDVVASGKSVLFVGTKKQAQEHTPPLSIWHVIPVGRVYGKIMEKTV